MTRPYSAVAFVLVAGARGAAADPIQLRADALATTAAPAGLVTVDATGTAADGGPGPVVTAEAMVWTGGNTPMGDHADVLVAAVRARTADGRAGLRLGRFVETLGALRPVQIDGAAARARLPYRLDVEAFAGIPVVPGILTARPWDWITGGRIARRLGDMGSVGIAYAEQRQDGELATEEVGVDAGAALGKRDDIAGKVAYDLANPGLAEAQLTASHRAGAVRVEVFSSYRAASHLLPATSLFTVLGDMPAERAGAQVTWKAAPRLDVSGDAAVLHAAGDTAPQIVLRAKLRLDPLGKSAVSCEARRDGVGDSAWTGLRGAARISLPSDLYTSTELELVIPDHEKGYGSVWPWALVALGHDSGPWHAALAGEASASPQDRRRLDVLVQVGRRWGMP